MAKWVARALKEAFEGTAVVLTPDLPLHPKEALKEIRSIIDREQPDLLLGNSCGSFLAQMLAPVVGIPALLGNPYFMMTEFLKERIGEHEYKAPRRDGNQRLVIDEALIEEFAELEAVQFDHCNPYYKDRVAHHRGSSNRGSRHNLFSITIGGVPYKFTKTRLYLCLQDDELQYQSR